jgi:transposase
MVKEPKTECNDQILPREYIMQIEFLNTEINNIESKIICEASKNESVNILMSMAGIDYYSAMMIASEIDDIRSRFRTPEKLASWSGLCTSIHQSGNSLYMGKMKDGNKKIRWIPIQAANTATRKDEGLRRFYLRIAKDTVIIGIGVGKQNDDYNMAYCLHIRDCTMIKKQNLYDAKLKRIQKT